MKAYEKTCHCCNQNFNTTRKTNDFCSYGCRKKWLRGLPKPNSGRSGSRRKNDKK